MLLSTWLGGGSLETAGFAVTAATHVALLNKVDILGTHGCLSWWGLRGWLPRGLGQNLGRSTPEGEALGICVYWQTEPRLPRGFWPEREDMGNRGLELKIPCFLPGVGEIMPPWLWCRLGGIIPGLRLF